jgi:ABC-type multidrug transport system fused ATPase/permease subunit
MLGQQTTIVIAHRLASIRNADRILVFDGARIAESGSHAELLTQDGIYVHLLRMQDLIVSAAPLSATPAPTVT